MKKIKKCPCCNSDKIEIKYSSLYDKSYFVDGNFSLYRCRNCKLEFLNPLPSEKELARYYPKDYYSFDNISKLSISYHKISAKYYSGSLLKLFLWPLKPLLYTYHVKRGKGKTLLEIGCGDGLKLKIYKKYGLNVYGLEPHGSILSEKEKRLGISRETIRNYKPEIKFDYIILKEVLEHIPNQEEVLKKCHGWLNENGKLIITLQNTNSLWKKIFKENWFGYDVPRHIYNYNAKNISFFLRKHGFKIEKIRIYDNPYMLTGSLKYYLISKAKNKKERKYQMFNSAFPKLIATPISLFVSYLNLGSLMEIEAGKIKL